MTVLQTTPLDPPHPRGAGGKERSIRVALLLLILAAFALRMWRLDAKSIWWDESLSLHRAQRDLGYILSNRIDFPGAETIDLHPPLYFVMLRAFVVFCGNTDLSLRFPSVVFATLLVPLLYIMGKHLRGVHAGLVAAALGAASPFYLWYGQEARMYTMVTALGLAAVYSLWRSFTPHRFRWVAAAMLLNAAAISTHYLHVLVLLFQALLGVALWGVRRRAPSAHPTRRAIIIGLGVMLACVLAGVAPIALDKALTPQDGRDYVPLGVMFRDALNSSVVGLSASLKDVWPLDLAFAVVYGLGLVSIWQRPPGSARTSWPGFLTLGAYLGVPILGMWAYSLYRSIYMGSRYVIMVSPAFYLGVGVGLDAIRRTRRAAAWVVMALLIAGMGLSDYRYFTHERYRTKEDYRSSAHYVMERERRGDVIILTAPENITAFEHYYHGALPIVPMPRAALNPSFDPAQLAHDMQAAIAGYSRVWLVHCRPQHSDPQDQVLGWLEDHLSLLGHQRFPSWGSSPMVNLYQADPPVEHNVSLDVEPLVIFGGRLALLDYAFHYHTVEGEQQSIRPLTLGGSGRAEIPSGGFLAVTFTWHTLASIQDLKASLKLMDDRGVVWAQRDRAFVEYAPTMSWPGGARIAQELDISIPPGTPPGEYHLDLVLYDAPDGQQWPFVSGDQDGAQPHQLPWTLDTFAVVRPKRFPTEADLPDSAQRMAARHVFGSSLELLARSMGPTVRKPGESLELHLYWRALSETGGNLQVVVNWDDGQVWHSTTHSLTGLNSPVASWQRGELIRSIVQLQVPDTAPRGPHTLHLLVYDPERGRYLGLRKGWLLWSGRDLPLGEITVE
jgi:hypothetical protein